MILTNITQTVFNFLKNILIKYALWYYTLLAVLLKSIAFLGLTLDPAHSSIFFNKAYSIAYDKISFYLGFILIFLSFAFLFKKRFRLWYLIIFNLLASTVLLIDLWYFRGFSTIPTLHVLQQSSNLDNMSGSILAMVYPVDLVFIFDIVVMTIVSLIGKKINRDTPRNIIMFASFLIISLCMILYIPTMNILSGKNVWKSVVYMYDSTVTSYNMSPIGYHIYSVYTFWKDSQTLELTPSGKEEISNWFEAKKENLPDNKYKGLFTGKNLIVIQVESLEAFVINKKIQGQEITPNLNKLLENSIYFSDFYEQVNEGNSSDAEFLANTSVYPLRQGSVFFRYPTNTYNKSLPNLLKSKGYSTLAIHPDDGSFWNWMVTLSSIGFDKCVDFKHFIYDEHIILGLSDGSYFKQVAPMLIKQKQPFYTFMITLTSHTPFDIPYQFRGLSLDKDFNYTTLGGYFQCINYVDRHLGAFIASLKEGGLLDNTVIAIYGDHEGIHKYFPKDVYDITPSESWWLENHKRVPFIIYSSDFKGEEIKTTGGQIDVLPTLSYLMGIDEKEHIHTAMGRNLLNTDKSFAIVKNGDYVGIKNSEEDAKNAVKGLDLADIIIRSNYFKTDP
ncbi:MAG: LTA synthase family protein [Clostridia bacterium]|nr:LTA synthase family protein [Clostridia bacterium]